MTNQIDEAQYQLVTELLQRQDAALEQLDQLCERVEKAIEEISRSRDSENDQDNEEETGEILEKAA